MLPVCLCDLVYVKVTMTVNRLKATVDHKGAVCRGTGRRGWVSSTVAHPAVRNGISQEGYD